ncbi:helix-turn-helix domain-containing protein [Actinopolymorpha rutila]|nr:helix-turn-helix domain-containing protein [Actinopolymorpha rutila]
MHRLLDTDELAPAERLEAWRELTSHTLLTSTEVDADRADGFRAALAATELGAGGVATLRCSSLRSLRTPNLIRRADPEAYTVALVQSGRQCVDHAGRRAVVGPGDLLVCSTSLPFTACVTADGVAASVVAQVPRAMVPLPHDKVIRLLAVPFSGRDGMGDLLARFLAHLTSRAPSATPGDSAGSVRLGAVLVDVLTALLADHVDADDSPPPGPRRQVLYLQIQAFIQSHLADPGLTPGAVAAANHVSTRYLHQIFEQHGRSVGAWIRELRLDRCRADLADPTQQLTPVSQVGARWGFTQAAAFSRTFRAAYGLPPREYRRQTLARRPTDQTLARRPTGDR